MAHGVTPESLAKPRSAATPGARAAFIVSPTYYGMAADVEGCARVAHEAGVPLVVDQSWGPHLGFHEALPPSALSLGADVMLTSVHKIAGSLTQSALLHVSGSGRIDPDEVARTLRLMRLDQSPSSLLMASFDGARRQLVLHGEALLSATIVASRRTAQAIDRIPGCRVVGDDQIGRPGVAHRDPLRLVIDVRATGATGYEMATALRSNFDTQVELATQATIVLVLGIDEPPRELERFIHDLTWIVNHMERPGEIEEVTLASGTFENEVVCAPREAFLGAVRGDRRRRVGRPRERRGDRRLPAGHPRPAAGRAHHRRRDRVPALVEGGRRAAARCVRPGLPHDPRPSDVSAPPRGPCRARSTTG